MKLQVLDEFNETTYKSYVFGLEEGFERSEKRLYSIFNVCIMVYVIAVCMTALIACASGAFAEELGLALVFSSIFSLYYAILVVKKDSLISKYESETSCKQAYNRYKALHDFCKSGSICVDFFNTADIVLKDEDGNSFSIGRNLVGVICDKLPVLPTQNVTLKISNNNAIFELD